METQNNQTQNEAQKVNGSTAPVALGEQPFSQKQENPSPAAMSVYPENKPLPTQEELEKLYQWDDYLTLTKQRKGPNASELKDDKRSAED